MKHSWHGFSLPGLLFCMLLQTLSAQAVGAQSHAGEKAQQLYQESLFKQGELDIADNIRNQLLSLWLNYTPDEMPDGGLAQHSETAITQGLVTGRGIVYPDWYSMPGSSRKLTGNFFDHQARQGWDPDCQTHHDAWWMWKEEDKPYWTVEREHGLPKDSLKEHASRESRSSYARRKESYS